MLQVFLRELVSNCSDALEKIRYLQSTNQHPTDSETNPLKISITSDESKRTITIRVC
jgi:molecular chaperone HtpG